MIMDYEKKYKEALEKAKEFYALCEKCGAKDTVDFLEDSFPELKESEDEKVRKELIKVFSNREKYLIDQSFGDITVSEVLAWLEKQGEQKPIIKMKSPEESLGISSKEYNEIVNDCLYGKSSPTDIVEPKFKEGEDERIRKRLIFDFQALRKTEWGDLKVKDILAWLEKQSESYTKRDVDNAFVEGMALAKNELEKQGGKKETLCDKCRKEQPSHSCQDITANGRCYIDDINTFNNGVEPKFKVGDWITNGEYTWKVTAIQPLDYILQSQDGNVVDDTISYVDKNFHLWTIQDAKDGDVLHSPTHNLIWIYKDIQHYYACVNMNYVKENFFINGFIVIPTDVCPATKDEQTILFTKMKEAGYEWNAELKELRKFPTPADVGFAELGKAWEKEAKDKKPAWSEEDEMFVHGLIRGLSAKRDIYGHTTFSSDCIDITETIKWLKSLKQRIGG